MSTSGNDGPAGHDYSGIDISGQAQVQLGDQHHQYYYINGTQIASPSLQLPEGSEWPWTDQQDHTCDSMCLQGDGGLGVDLIRQALNTEMFMIKPLRSS